jgi:16S rRNA (uracil1498-N3)-methyltransferase
MHRFYMTPERCAGTALLLDGREAHHALHVLRLKNGDLVSVHDGVGNELLCIVENTDKASLTLKVNERKYTPPPFCPVTLLVAVPKGKIIEDIIQKSVELGASRIVPLLTERVVMQLDDEGAAQKQLKWRQVAIEAIKQCGAAWLPEIEMPGTIESFIARKERIDLAFVGSLQTERRHPHEWFKEFQARQNRLPQSAAIWIGPEGDFTLEELKRIEASGALPITLGPLTLRVETAAIYCLSIINYELSSCAAELANN